MRNINFYSRNKAFDEERCMTCEYYGASAGSYPCIGCNKNPIPEDVIKRLNEREVSKLSKEGGQC